MKNVRAYLLLFPCHLPVLMALLAGGLSGGAVAGFLRHNIPLMFVLSALYFFFALWMGNRLLNRPAACSLDAHSPTPSGKP